MEKIIKLAKKTEAKWKKLGAKVEDLPELSAEALAKVDLNDVTINKIYSWLSKQNKMPKQFLVGDTFGEPCITIYDGEYIIADLLCWTSGDTNIHSHGFSGAFKVMQGSTVQAIYKVNLTKSELSKDLIIKPVELDELKYLKKGDIQKIPTGIDFIHKSYHCSIPTINLIFRVKSGHSNKKKLIQHSVILPNILTQSFFIDEKLVKEISFINMLMKVKDNGWKLKLSKLLRSLEDYKVIGLHLQLPLTIISFTEKTKKILITYLIKELKSRNLYKLIQNTKSFNYMLNENSHDIFKTEEDRIILSLFSSNQSFEKINNFLELNGFKTKNLSKKMIKILKKLNKSEQLSINADDSAFEFLELFLNTKDIKNVADRISKKYEVSYEIAYKDAKSIIKSFKKVEELKLLLN